MTTLNAEKVKTETTPGQFADGLNGLVLRIGASGKKIWAVRARQRGGGSQTVKIGCFPALTLQQAREKARAVFITLGDGVTRMKKDEGGKRRRKRSRMKSELSF